MTESEIVYQISEILNRLWVIQQWWASVSFGVLIVAHLASKQLNGVLVSALLFLYSVYSFYMWDLLGINAGILNGFVNDLQQMSESGHTLTSGGNAYILERRLSYFLVPLTLFGTYFCTAGYLVYGYFKGKSSRNAQPNGQ